MASSTRTIAYPDDYLRRQCGIATSTFDLLEAVAVRHPRSRCFAVPVTDRRRDGFLTFGILLWAFQASTIPSLFHIGWFAESLATQTLVVFVIRTTGNPFQSRPSRALRLSVSAVAAIATVLPYTPLGSLLRFTSLPAPLLGAIAFLAVSYLPLVRAAKTWFYRRHALL